MGRRTIGPFTVPVVVALAGILSCSASGAVLVTGADLVGFRDSTQLVTADGWDTDEGGFKIAWDISFDDGGTDLWTYAYTVTNDSGSALAKALSHWLLEVSPAITPDNVNFAIPEIPNDNFDLLGPQTWDADPDSPNNTSPGGNNANPNLPADIYAIKLDTGSDEVPGGTYTFKSTQSPIWGDFYGKDGVSGRPNGAEVATVWNTGIGTDPTDETTDFTPWIPTPDTETVIPEPPSILVWSLLACLGAVVGVSHRRD